MADRVVGRRRLHRRRPKSKWSEIQSELLELILEKLDLADHARFASVCSSWRSVAVENPPINKPLYFALSHDPKNLVRRFITSFIPSWNQAWFIGGLDGWVVILIDRKDLFLLNKAFNSIIPLPPPPPPTKYRDNFFERPHLCKAVLSSPPSSGECTVVINHYSSAGMFYYRLGSDKPFTKLWHIPNFAEDILFYKGRLYVLCYRCTKITIYDLLLNKEVSQSVINFPDIHISWRLLILRNNILSIVAGEPHRYFVCMLEGSEPRLFMKNTGESHQYFVCTLEGSEPRLVMKNNIREDDNFQILLNNIFCSLSITTKDHTEFLRPTDNLEDSCSTSVLDTSKDPEQAKADDPWPLFFFMFSVLGIHNLVE